MQESKKPRKLKKLNGARSDIYNIHREVLSYSKSLTPLERLLLRLENKVLKRICLKMLQRESDLIRKKNNFTIPFFHC